MTFYKIKNGLPQVGTGNKIPDGFIEYQVGKEPQELKKALEVQKSIENNEIKISKANQYLKETDWIITKINEYKILERDVSDLLKKYSTELKKREKARNLIST